MSDRITTYNDCPKCGAKGMFECYEQLGAYLKVDSCNKCDYQINYDFEEKDGVIHITAVTEAEQSIK